MFLAARNIIYKKEQKKSVKGPKLSGKEQKTLEAFMNDLAINTVLLHGARWILNHLGQNVIQAEKSAEEW